MVTDLRQVIGNDKLKRRSLSAVRSRNFTHACIIEGAPGSGKHLIARNTAAALCCENTRDINTEVPCRMCRNCRIIFDDKCPDVITVGAQGKSSVGVEAARFITGDANSYPNMLPYRIYIIEDADKMTAQAQNAFLLTLEEPPSFVKFFLLCENASVLLETVRSRAPVFRTERLSDDIITDFLRNW